MRMLRDNVLVEQLDKEQVGRIILPQCVNDEWFRGRVVKVGPGYRDVKGEVIPPDIQVGDIVIYPPPLRGAYPVITADGIECIILNENCIWAVESSTMETE